MRLTCGLDAEVPRTMTVAPVGNLDAHGATQLWEVASPRITAEAPNLLLDMTGVAVFSSAGIGTIVRLLKHAQGLGGAMAVFGCTPRVRAVLKLSALETILQVCDDPEEARARLKQGGAE